MEDLFGGERNMFNPAATEDNDEDQPAGSQTLLQRAQERPHKDKVRSDLLAL